MRNMLVVYPSMNIGGSTTSLLGFLGSMDYKEWKLDLQLYENVGPYLTMIPDYINLLPEARKFSKNEILGKIQRMLHPNYWYYGIKAFKALKNYPGTLAGAQVTAYARANTSKKNKKRYDIAIGFLEMWSDAYVFQKVKAQKKIAWIHVDYIKAGLIPELDERMFKSFDKIVLVSEQCLKSFRKTFPQFKSKTYCIENILLKEVVEKRAREFNVSIRKGGILNLGTVCRIEFRSKGLDRAVKILYKLKEEGKKFVWHIIGDGADFSELKTMIFRLDLQDSIFLYGALENPLPYVKEFDAFFLPSHYEGKPMAVTEAQMLGIPTIVTNYSAAHEQIQDGIDGLIVENSDEGIFYGLKTLLDNISVMRKLKKNILKKEWDYTETIQTIKNVILEEK